MNSPFAFVFLVLAAALLVGAWDHPEEQAGHYANHEPEYSPTIDITGHGWKFEKVPMEEVQCRVCDLAVSGLMKRADDLSERCYGPDAPDICPLSSSAGRQFISDSIDTLCRTDILDWFPAIEHQHATHENHRERREHELDSDTPPVIHDDFKDVVRESCVKYVTPDDAAKAALLEDVVTTVSTRDRAIRLWLLIIKAQERTCGKACEHEGHFRRPKREPVIRGWSASGKEL